jgi:FdhD protein
MSGQASSERAVVQVRDGRVVATGAPDRVVVEAPLELRVGGKPLTVVMRTPGQDEELARGFLYSEGMIGSLADLLFVRRPDGLTGDEAGNVLDLHLAPPPVGLGGPGGPKRPALERSFVASSSCGVCGKTSIAQLAIHAQPLRSSLRVSRATLSSLPERLRAAQAVFSQTGGLHASAIFDAAGTPLAAREDVGRHNALDKLIGWALAEGRLPLSDTILMVSGRVSFEILQKAIVAGLPMVAAVSAPSSLAVDLAERFGVTLVGFLRGASMNVYAHAERVVD